MKSFIRTRAECYIFLTSALLLPVLAPGLLVQNSQERAQVALDKASTLASLSYSDSADAESNRIKPFVLVRHGAARPLVFCAAPRTANKRWLRLFLRASGKITWNEREDDLLHQAFAKELNFIGPLLDRTHGTERHSNQRSFVDMNLPAIKVTVVRDPVVRMLDGYLRVCKDEGAWERCGAKGPVSFAKVIESLAQVGLEHVDPTFMRHVDICRLDPEDDFDFVGRAERIKDDSVSILKQVGLWEEFGQQGWDEFGEASFAIGLSDNSTEEKVCDFYSPELLKMVEELYAADFEAYGYKVEPWRSRCESSWSFLEVETGTLLRRALPSKAGPLPLGGRSVCAPTEEELLSLSGLSKSATDPKLPTFYLHNTGAFDFTALVDCFLKGHGLTWSKHDWDDHLPANIVEHLSELWLLRGMESHPLRTRNVTEATVHIIGSPMYTSLLVSTMTECKIHANHTKRMQELTNSLESLDAFRKSEGRNFFLFMTHYDVAGVFTMPLLKLLNRGNVMIGTADRDYVQWSQYPGISRFVTLPYKTHDLLDNKKRAKPQLGAGRTLRNISFVFHGTMGRRHEGRDRKMMTALTGYLENADLRNITFQMYAPNMTSGTASEYLRSHFCLVPAGDSPTSRRLFDALAAGCTPVVFGRFDRLVANLPFQKTIDWTQLLLFGGSLQCVANDLKCAGDWLQDLADGMDAPLTKRMRHAGREVYREALSYSNGIGIVTALARELAHLSSDAD